MKGSIFYKMQTSTCWIVCLVLLGVYLFAALRPGVWLRDAFLYRQADGSFSARMPMRLHPAAFRDGE